MHVAVASLSTVGSRTISRAGVAVQFQLVAVQVGLVEVELVSAVALDLQAFLLMTEL